MTKADKLLKWGSLLLFIFLIVCRPQILIAGSRFQSTIALSGQCNRLILRGEDETRHCTSKMLNTTFSNGRSEFYFILTNDIILTFSGPGQGQIKLSEDTIIQPIDSVVVIHNGKSAATKAIGKCRFENPYKGSVPITCQADTSTGIFSGSFLTDGSTPTKMKL